MITRIALGLPLLVAIATCAAAQDQNKPQVTEKDKIINLGGLRVNYTRKFIEIDSLVSLNRGLIELFACTPKGKAYESAVVLDCKPTHLMTGLFLLGLKKGSGGKFQGDTTAPKGSKVLVLVTWIDPKTKKTRRYFAEDLVWNHRAKRPMKRTGWIFIGSRFVKNPNTGQEIFMASYTGTVIVTYHDPSAILDTPSDKGGDDTTFYANHMLMPKRGTKLKLLIYPEKIYNKLPQKQQAMPLPDFNKLLQPADKPQDNPAQKKKD